MRIKLVSILIAIAVIIAATPAAFADDNTTTNDAKVTTVTKKTVATVYVTARATGKGAIKIKWKPIKGSKGYKIYRATKKNGKYKRVARTFKWNKKAWLDKGKNTKVNKVYYYKIRTNKKVIIKTTVKKVVGTLSTESTKSTSTTTSTTKGRLAKVKNTLKVKKSFKVVATAYSGGGRCANGMKVGVGRIAVDPKVIKLGTWVYVQGYGLAQACDTGGAIKGKRVDLYMKGGEKNCDKYGRRTVKINIL